MSDTRETLKAFLNLFPETAGQTSISFSHNKPAGDQIERGDDIKKDPQSQKTLIDLDNPDPESLLGDYISFLTENAEHVFPLERGAEPSPPTKRGDYLAISSNHGADKIFLLPGTEEASNFNRYSNNHFQNIQDLIDKNGNLNDPEYGHKALSSIQGTGLSSYGQNVNAQGIEYRSGDENKITQAVQNEVLSKSRFGNIPDKEIYKEINENDNAFENKDNIKINNSFGKHFTSEQVIKLEQLKSLGASLILKASGFEDGITPGDSLDPAGIEESMDSDAGGSLKSNKISSSTSKVFNDLLRSKNAFGSPRLPGQDESIRDGRGSFFEDDRSSYGSTYNTGMHFNGRNHKIHKMQAALSITLLKELSSNIYNNIIAEYTSTNSSDMEYEFEEKVSDMLRYVMGKSTVSINKSNESFAAAIFSGKYLNFKMQAATSRLFVPTRYPYNSCIERGMKVIFNDSVNISDSLGPDVSTEEVKNIKESLGISTSPGFWLAVAKSVTHAALKLIDDIYDFSNDLLTQSDSGEERILNFIKKNENNKVIGFMNVMATVGDASFQAFSGEALESDGYKNRPWDVDKLPDTPATRVSKSRKNNGYTENQLAWSQNDVPSAYILPINSLRAAGRLDNIITGPNPFTAMMGSRVAENTYFSAMMDGSSNRIPKEVVKSLENQLDAEYVPFYFHDLRTNEIISFHAFLDSLSDSITPNYSTFNGYGRLDPVRIYEGTTRSVGVGFTVVATSKEDFDAMWYKINKFVTLLYPQWTKGTLVGYDLEGGVTSKFIQPNSQVLGASPIVRMRIGDIIKSNYSKFNFARIFGIGDGDVNPIVASDANTEWARGLANIVNNTKSDVLNVIKDVAVSIIGLVFGSPVQITQIPQVIGEANKSAIGAKTLSALTSVLTNHLKNGFVNPLILSANDNFGFVDARIKIPKSNEGNIEQNKKGVAEKGPNEGFIVYLKANNISGYEFIEGNYSGKRFLIQKPIRVKLNKKIDPLNYEVEIQDYSLPADVIGSKLKCNAIDIYQMPNDSMVNTLEFGIALAAAGGFINPLIDFGLNTTTVRNFAASTGTTPLFDVVRSLFASNESNFMESYNNPFVKAYETTAGRGLAGTVGAVQFDWLSDFPWEIDHNSRAPIGCKISFNFDVIHDIVPGLDHTGYNRAPLYNVGNVMRGVSGDTYDSFYKEDEMEFNKSHGKAVKIKGKPIK